MLRTTVGRDYYACYDLDPITGKGRELARTRWLPALLGDWDISPDGKYVAISNHDSHEARIRVVALEPKPNETREREMTLEHLSDIRGLAWAADSTAWFLSVDTSLGNRLLYVYPDGSFR